MGKDVAEALGYFNTSKAIRDHVSEDDLKTLKYKAYNVSGEASLWKGMIILINLSSTNPVSTLSSSAASSKKLKSLSVGLQLKFFLLFARPGVILKVASSQSTTTALSLLREEEFLDKTVRVFGTPENPLFLARDVAEWIDYSKRPDGSYKMDVFLKNVDVKEKIKIFNPAYNKGGVLQINTEYWFLTENGLYEVLMLSRKPKAKQFKIRIK